MAKTLNLQRVELRLPFGLGEVFKRSPTAHNCQPEKRTGIINFLKEPPNRIYSNLLFVYLDEPGKEYCQYLEIKLTKNIGVTVEKKDQMDYIRLAQKGRLLYLRIPVISTTKIDKLVNTIMDEANILYLTVCETL